jgi:hypothetical protein
MKTLDLINMFSAAVSTVLAVVALWLSITFYRMSKDESQRSQRSAEEIAASVKRLEVLFQTLYSDTFGIVRDTVTDMRTYVWHRNESTVPDGTTVDSIASEVLELTRKELADSITGISQRLGVTEGKLSELREEITPEIEAALRKTQEFPKTHDAEYFLELLELIVEALRKEGPSSVHKLSRVVPWDSRYPRSQLMEALFNLRDQGRVTWDRPGDMIRWEDVVRLTQ